MISVASRVLVILSFCGLVGIGPTAARGQTTRPAVADGQWQPLFNGRDLAGWYTFLKGVGKDIDPEKVFQVHDGMLHIYKDAEEGSRMPFGYVCTEQDFSDYRLRFQYRWGGKRFAPRAKSRRDSGLLYHVIGEDGFQSGVWPRSVECQIQENDTGDTFAIGTRVSTTIDPATKDAKAPTFMEKEAGGVPYTSPPAGNNRIIRNPMAEIDGWNSVEVIIRGDTAVHIVNGRVNKRLTHMLRPDPEKEGAFLPLTRGRILFQAEGAEVLYRQIEIQPLPSKQAHR